MKTIILHLCRIILYFILGKLSVSAAVPVIALSAPDSIISTSVRFRASITSPNGTVSERRFEWKVGYVNGAQFDSFDARVGTAGNEFWFTLANLPPNTVVGYRAWAKNASGWGWSAIGTVRTAASATPPSVQTLPAQTTGDLLRLRGAVVSANGGTVTATRFHFRIGGSGPWDSSTAIPNGSEFNVDMRGLSGGTRVDYYFSASNSSGTGNGATLTATAPYKGPVVETLASETTSAGLRLRGRIVYSGTSAVTSSRIRWSFDGGSVWDDQSTMPDAGGHFACELRGVLAGTIIQYQAEATGGGFTNRGSILLTTMPAFPPMAPIAFAASRITANYVIVGGRAIGSNGGSPLQWATVEWSHIAGVWDGTTMASFPVGADGSFSATLSELAPATYIAWRWRVTNQAGLWSDWSSLQEAYTSEPVGFRPEIVGMTFEDTDDRGFQHGDGDGLVEAGDAGTLYLRVVNSGDLTASAGSTVQFLSDVPAALRLVYPKSVHDLGGFEPGSEKVLVFRILIPAGSPQANPTGILELPFTLQFDAGKEEDAARLFQLPATLSIYGRNGNLSPPTVDLAPTVSGDICVSVPAWSAVEWKLQESKDLRKWTDVTLPEANPSGVLKSNFLRGPGGFFRMAKR